MTIATYTTTTQPTATSTYINIYIEMYIFLMVKQLISIIYLLRRREEKGIRDGIMEGAKTNKQTNIHNLHFHPTPPFILSSFTS